MMRAAGRGLPRVTPWCRSCPEVSPNTCAWAPCAGKTARRRAGGKNPNYATNHRAKGQHMRISRRPMGPVRTFFKLRDFEPLWYLSSRNTGNDAPASKPRKRRGMIETETPRNDTTTATGKHNYAKSECKRCARDGPAARTSQHAGRESRHDA